MFLCLHLFSVQVWSAEEGKENTAKSLVVEEKEKTIDPKALRHFKLGIAQMRKNNNLNALKHFADSIAVDQTLAGPHINRGIIYYTLNDFESAYSEFNWAVRKNPKHIVGLNYMALLHKEKGKFKKAKEYYEKAIESDPKYAQSYYNLGVLCDLFMKDIKCALDNYIVFHRLTNQSEKAVEIWITDLSNRYQAQQQQQLSTQLAQQKAEEESKLTPEKLARKKKEEMKRLEKQRKKEEEKRRDEQERQVEEQSEAEERKARALKKEKERIADEKERKMRDKAKAKERAVKEDKKQREKLADERRNIAKKKQKEVEKQRRAIEEERAKRESERSRWKKLQDSAKKDEKQREALQKAMINERKALRRQIDRK